LTLEVPSNTHEHPCAWSQLVPQRFYFRSRFACAIARGANARGQHSAAETVSLSI